MHVYQVAGVMQLNRYFTRKKTMVAKTKSGFVLIADKIIEKLQMFTLPQTTQHFAFGWLDPPPCVVTVFGGCC